MKSTMQNTFDLLLCCHVQFNHQFTNCNSDFEKQKKIKINIVFSHGRLISYCFSIRNSIDWFAPTSTSVKWNFYNQLLITKWLLVIIKFNTNMNEWMNEWAIDNMLFELKNCWLMLFKHKHWVEIDLIFYHYY